MLHENRTYKGCPTNKYYSTNECKYMSLFQIKIEFI